MEMYRVDYKVVRKLSWFEFMEPTYIRLKIIPDSSARNHRTEDIIRALCDSYMLPIERTVRNGLIVSGFMAQDKGIFEVEFKDNKVQFYLTTTKTLAPLIIRRMYSVWERCTIEEVEQIEDFDPKSSSIYSLSYRKHDIYSLSVDNRDNHPLTSIIEAGRLLEEGERASLITILEPIYQLGYQYEIAKAWHKLRNGTAPRKVTSGGSELFKSAALSVTYLLRELMIEVSKLFGSDSNRYATDYHDIEASPMAIMNLSDSTKKKQGKYGVKTSIFSISQSNNPNRADLISRTLALSLADLNGDNDLIPKKIKVKDNEKVISSFKTGNITVNIRPNLFSTAETSKLIQIPGLELQEQYPEVVRKEQKEVEIVAPLILDSKGIPLGVSTYKGIDYAVHQPINDKDELCLPHVGIGGMGQGKTKGLLSNFLLEYIKKGFGGLAIDPAKGEIGKELQAAVKKGYLEADKLEVINLGVEVFSLDFCEAMADDRGRARLANIVSYFFGVAEETTGQTERFLRAAVMAMETGKIEEIVNIFNRQSDLMEAIKRLKAADDTFNLQTLTEYESYSESKRRQVVAPIYNRLNDILADPHLSKCMKSDKQLDMVDILSNKKAYIFDVPAMDLDKVSIDIIVSLLSLKIDLAMRMREKITGEDFPFAVLIDEPHQFSKSTGTWESAVVESRKWGICYFWTFHYWEQIPSKLQKAIRSALPHYHLYPTSTQTWNSLKDEIHPFSIAEALKLKRWNAINIIRSGGENATPFIASMLKPPSIRIK